MKIRTRFKRMTKVTSKIVLWAVLMTMWPVFEYFENEDMSFAQAVVRANKRIWDMYL